MRRAIALVGVAAAIVGATYVVRGARPADPPESGRPAGPGLALGTAAVGTAPGSGRRQEIDRLIAVYEEQVRRQPSALDYTFLGNLYAQRGRLTGDVATYDQAEEALTRALEIFPEDPEARELLASVRFSSHDFLGALEIANRLLAEEPGHVAALAVAGDARLELGDYPGATAAYDELARRLPGAAAVDVRRARLAQLLGEVEEARRLAARAEEAAQASGLDGPDLAWYWSFRGSIELEDGRYGTAAALYRAAVRLAPRFHVARAGLGKALSAEGQVDQAIHHLGRATEILPDPGYLAALGDLYLLRGDRVRARDQYATVEAVAALARANRRVYNRQLVTFYADHDRRPAEAVALAARELAVRKDVYGWDAYGWALYRAGRLAEARLASDRALRLGTRDARLFYHSGLISLSLGEEERAASDLQTALNISPVFDPLQARTARRALQALKGP